MVTSSTGKVQYVLTSGNQAVAVPFFFIENSHVRVIRTRAGVDEPLVSGFSLAGAGNEAGGTLTFTGLETQAGDRITIKRSVPLTQLVRYVPNDKFPASTHERALDRVTMILQQVLEQCDRALVYGEGEVVANNNTFPRVALRSGRIVGFDDDGNLDMTVLLDDLRTLIIANPVDGLTDVTDYGEISDAVDETADYGSIT
jgi:hypothetical protein